MANKLRGEVEVELFGKKFVLKPDFESICQVDDMHPDHSLALIYRDFARNKITLKAVAIVIAGCLRGAGERYELVDVMKEIKRIGYTSFFGPASKLCVSMILPEEMEQTIEDEKKKDPASLEVVQNIG